jgi:nucleoid DNA-binding protein
MQETDWKLVCERVAEKLGLAKDDVENHILHYAETLRDRMKSPTKVELDFFRVGYLRISRFKCDRASKAYRTRLDWELDYLQKLPHSESLKKSTTVLKSQIAEADKAALIADEAFGVQRLGSRPETPLLKSVIKNGLIVQKSRKNGKKKKAC